MLGFVENKIFAAARPKDQEGGLGYDVKLADAITAALPSIEKGFPDQAADRGPPAHDDRAVLLVTWASRRSRRGNSRRPGALHAGTSAPTTPTRSGA